MVWRVPSGVGEVFDLMVCHFESVFILGVFYTRMFVWQNSLFFELRYVFSVGAFLRSGGRFCCCRYLGWDGQLCASIRSVGRVRKVCVGLEFVSSTLTTTLFTTANDCTTIMSNNAVRFRNRLIGTTYSIGASSTSRIIALNRCHASVFGTINGASTLVPFAVRLGSYSPIITTGTTITFSNRTSTVGSGLLTVTSDAGAAATANINVRVLSGASTVLGPSKGDFSAGRGLVPKAGILRFSTHCGNANADTSTKRTGTSTAFVVECRWSGPHYFRLCVASCGGMVCQLSRTM